MFGRKPRLDEARQAAEQHMLACLPRLRRYARALAGERSAADDLVQDTLERAWQKLDTWNRTGDMRPWLFSIMHNLFVDQRRKPALPVVEWDQAQAQAMDGQMADAWIAPAGRGLALDLEAALRLLPAEQREVLLLVALEDLRYEEAAATLGIPVGTVMSRLSRARERLRLLMDGAKGVRPEPLGTAALKVVK